MALNHLIYFLVLFYLALVLIILVSYQNLVSMCAFSIEFLLFLLMLLRVFIPFKLLLIFSSLALLIY